DTAARGRRRVGRRAGGARARRGRAHRRAGRRARRAERRAARGRRPPRAARPAARHRQLAPPARARPAPGDARVNVKRLLERVPADSAAQERAWAVVREAYRAREPARARRPVRLRVAFAVAGVALACAAAALSPPGRAVVNAVRRSIGIEGATPTAFRLPAPGRVLVSGAGGTWVASEDGSLRRLGSWPAAAWSPHGLFVVAADAGGLTTVEPGSGIVHWSLARRNVRLPRWGGTRTDTRVAYLSGGSLRVVAGDGTGDRLLARRVASAAPAWQSERHVLAYATAARAVVVRNVDTGAILAEHRARGRVRALAWSADRKVLAVATTRDVELFQAALPERMSIRFSGVRALAFSPDGSLALLTTHALLVYSSEGVQTLLRVQGRLAGLAWSPDGRWLMSSLPRADQWVFVGRGRVLAVSHVARRLGGADPTLDGWVPGA